MATRRTGTRRRAEDEPKPGAKPEEAKATCGRKAADECGLKDPDECAIHGKADDPPDDKPEDEKRLRRLLTKLGVLSVHRADDDPPDPSDVPPEHQDAIRIAHKSMRTCKAFMTEAMGHYKKGMDLLDGVVEAMNDGPPGNDDASGDGDPDDKPNADDKAKQLQRAAELRARIRPAA